MVDQVRQPPAIAWRGGAVKVSCTRWTVAGSDVLAPWERRRLLALDDHRLGRLEAACWADPFASAASLHALFEGDGITYDQCRLMRRVLGMPTVVGNNPEENLASTALEEWNAQPVETLDVKRETLVKRMRDDGVPEDAIVRLLAS